MDLLQNPFHVLNASPHDNSHRIMELADDLSLSLESDKCMEARSNLNHPMKRLSAEVAWLPGIEPKRAEELLSLVKSAPANLLHVYNLPPIARINLLAAALTRFPNANANNVRDWILEISWEFEHINSDELIAIINEERIVSNFPAVSDLSDVEVEVQGRRRHYRQVIQSALDNLSPQEIVDTVTSVVDVATNKGSKHGTILIDDIVDAYALEAQVFLDKEEENIKALVKRLRIAVDGEKPDSVLAPIVNLLIRVVRNWDKVAQPIQVSAKSRGLDHEASHRVALLVRDLAIHIFNEHDKLNFSQQLTKMLQDAFAEVGEISERTAEDADALNDIAKQRVRLKEVEKNKADAWRREITYEADVGAIFKDKLRISPDGIEWKGQRLNVNSITRMRWGGTRHSINGISTGTTYNIIIGAGSKVVSIELKKELIYSNFVDRLWRIVGVRLLTELLEALQKGKTYRLGSSVVSDEGIELERKKLFGSNERVFCRWGELVAWNSAGAFCIGKTKDKKLAAAFSYLDEDNIHVLEVAARMLLKRGGGRLSSLLDK